MRKYFSCFVFLSLSYWSFSQEKPFAKGDTIYTSIGWNIGTKQDVRLGVGTLPNGDFKYLTTSTLGWSHLLNGTKVEIIGRKFNGHLMRVKKFREEGNKKRGYTLYVVLGGGLSENVECDIENAIATGEIEVPKEFKKTHLTEEQALSNIKKAKEKLELGLINQQQFDSVKAEMKKYIQ